MKGTPRRFEAPALMDAHRRDMPRRISGPERGAGALRLVRSGTVALMVLSIVLTAGIAKIALPRGARPAGHALEGAPPAPKGSPGKPPQTAALNVSKEAARPVAVSAQGLPVHLDGHENLAIRTEPPLPQAASEERSNAWLYGKLENQSDLPYYRQNHWRGAN